MCVHAYVFMVVTLFPMLQSWLPFAPGTIWYPQNFDPLLALDTVSRTSYPLAPGSTVFAT